MKNLLLAFITTSILIVPVSSSIADDTVINSLMKNYQSQGAKAGNAKNGEKYWSKVFTGKAPFTERSCKTCHTANLKNEGKHIRTGKVLKPIAPSINSASLTEANKIKKWLKRNCKWTTGKECNPQEKSDILAFIKQQ